MTAERTKQRRAAVADADAKGERLVSMFTYRCADGRHFQAVARTEAGAFRVLNAERGAIGAEFLCREEIEADLVRVRSEEA